MAVKRGIDITVSGLLLLMLLPLFLLVALAIKAPLGIAAVIVGVFAIFHGHAHGTELPDAGNPLAAKYACQRLNKGRRVKGDAVRKNEHAPVRLQGRNTKIF